MAGHLGAVPQPAIVTAVDGEARKHDAAGNTTSTGSKAFTYNDANRMNAVKQGDAALESYSYNHRGERVLCTQAKWRSTDHVVRRGWVVAGELFGHGPSATAGHLAGQLPSGVINVPGTGTSELDQHFRIRRWRPVVFGRSTWYVSLRVRRLPKHNVRCGRPHLLRLVSREWRRSHHCRCFVSAARSCNPRISGDGEWCGNGVRWSISDTNRTGWKGKRIHLHRGGGGLLWYLARRRESCCHSASH